MKGVDVNDPNTIELIYALFSSYEPSVKKIQKVVGLSKSLVSKRLDHLRGNGILTGFDPRINPLKCGIDLLIFNFYDLAKNMKLTDQKIKRIVRNDPHVMAYGDMFGPGNKNTYLVSLFEDVNAWNTNQAEEYWKEVPQLQDFIKDRQSILASLSHIKKTSTLSNIAIELLSESDYKPPEDSDPLIFDKDTIAILRALQKDVYELSYTKVQEKTALSRSFIHKKTKELFASGIIQAIDPYLILSFFGFNTILFGFYNFDERNRNYVRVLDETYGEHRVAYWGKLMGDRVINHYLIGLFRDGIEYMDIAAREYRQKTSAYPSIIRKEIVYLAPIELAHKLLDPSEAVIGILRSKLKKEQST